MRLENDVDSREKVRRIINQLSGIGGRRSIGFGHNRVLSLPDAIARVLSDHFGFKIYEKMEKPVESPKPTTSKIKPDICPACGEASMIHEEGCSKCYACGNSLC